MDEAVIEAGTGVDGGGVVVAGAGAAALGGNADFGIGGMERIAGREGMRRGAAEGFER